MSDAKLIVRDLLIRNFKGAKQVTIYNAGPGLYEVTGDNEAGKTSTRQALPALLAGLRFKEGELRLWDDALTHGATKGLLHAVLRDLNETGECELDGLTIRRVFSRDNQGKGGTLVAKTKDGRKLGQNELSTLFGDCAFDPLAWGRKNTEDQIKSLDDLVDPESLAALREIETSLAEAEEKRTATNREIKQYGRIPDMPKVEPVDTAELMRQLRAVTEHNQLQDRIEHERAAILREVATAAAAVDKAEDALRIAQQAHRRLMEELEAAEHPSARSDTAPLQQALSEAGETNAKHEQWRANDKARQELSALTRRSLALDQKVEDLRESKRQLHETTKAPIDGLEWDAKGIRWDGVVYSGLAESQRLRLSIMVEMARHPALHVMVVPDIDLLDDKNFAWLMQVVRDGPYQVFTESVRGARGEDEIKITLGEYGTVEPWEE